MAQLLLPMFCCSVTPVYGTATVAYVLLQCDAWMAQLLLPVFCCSVTPVHGTATVAYVLLQCDACVWHSYCCPCSVAVWRLYMAQLLLPMFCCSVTSDMAQLLLPVFCCSVTSDMAQLLLPMFCCSVTPVYGTATVVYVLLQCDACIWHSHCCLCSVAVWRLYMA